MAYDNMNGGPAYGGNNPTQYGRHRAAAQSAWQREMGMAAMANSDEIRRAAERMVASNMQSQDARDYQVQSTKGGQGAQYMALAGNQGGMFGTQGNIVKTYANVAQGMAHGMGVNLYDGGKQVGSNLSTYSNGAFQRASSIKVARELNNQFKDSGTTSGLNQEEMSEIANVLAQKGAAGNMMKVNENSTMSQVYHATKANTSNRRLQARMKFYDKSNPELTADEKFAKLQEDFKGDSSATADIETGMKQLGKMTAVVDKAGAKKFADIAKDLAGGIADMKDIYGSTMSVYDAVGKMEAVTGTSISTGRQAREARAKIERMTNVATASGIDPGEYMEQVVRSGRENAGNFMSKTGLDDRRGAAALATSTAIAAAVQERTALDGKRNTGYMQSMKEAGVDVQMPSAEFRTKDGVRIVSKFMQTDTGRSYAALAGAAETGRLSEGDKDTFAKLKQAYDSASTKGERASIGSQMKTLLGNTGMSDESIASSITAARQDASLWGDVTGAALRNGHEREKRATTKFIRRRMKPASTDAERIKNAIAARKLGGMFTENLDHEDLLELSEDPSKIDGMQKRGLVTAEQAKLFKEQNFSSEDLRVTSARIAQSGAATESKSSRRKRAAVLLQSDNESVAKLEKGRQKGPQGLIKGLADSILLGEHKRTVSDAESLTMLNDEIKEGRFDNYKGKISKIHKDDGINDDELGQMASAAGVSVRDFLDNSGFKGMSEEDAKKQLANKENTGARRKLNDGLTHYGVVQAGDGKGGTLLASKDTMKEVRDKQLIQKDVDRHAFAKLSGVDSSSLLHQSMLHESTRTGDDKTFSKARMESLGLSGEAVLSGEGATIVSKWDSAIDKGGASLDVLRKANKDSGGAVESALDARVEEIQKIIKDGGAEATMFAGRDGKKAHEVNAVEELALAKAKRATFLGTTVAKKDQQDGIQHVHIVNWTDMGPELKK